MAPAVGERLIRFVGDQVSFSLRFADGRSLPAGWQARLRTNLGRGAMLRREIIHAHTGQLRLSQPSWRDLTLATAGDNAWGVSLALTEVGFFRAKAYAIDPAGRQHWPPGPDFGVSVQPDAYRTANTIYCAFPRMFGPTAPLASTVNEELEHVLTSLDRDGFTVIPASGKLRDLARALPHIIDTLGCRILHLLPVNPTPTTNARFGRFGSPYACQDFLAIDPALVEFDKRTTGVDQFRELTYETHLRGGRVFLDVVANHTGWGSTLQENHPGWFVRRADGEFVSPGAWGTTWEDLVELDHSNRALWEHLAEVFLEWCRRGVDGFRCDAGYKIPVPAWRYITARVHTEFPDTIFLLEGLGGSWEATENLLTEGGMQWAYSELFQNYSRHEIADYLDYALRQSTRVGLYVHYSETHDNERLARLGRQWSLLRNRLCALTSVSGGFGFTCGVEWLAPERLQVHQSRGLAWGRSDNILPELARLNELLDQHPCFFDGARLTRLSAAEDQIYALGRESQEGLDCVLVLVNPDTRQTHTLALSRKIFRQLGEPSLDLLGQNPPVIEAETADKVVFRLEAGAAFCLGATAGPRGLDGDRYRCARAQSAWGITVVSRHFAGQDISAFDWRKLSALVARSPREFLGALTALDPAQVRSDLITALETTLVPGGFPQVISWCLPSRHRVTLVPHDHWLLIDDDAPFRAVLRARGLRPQHEASIEAGGRHYACFAPGQPVGDAEIELERYTQPDPRLRAPLRFLGAVPKVEPDFRAPGSLVLLTNGRGGMARLGVDLGAIRSKYDCLLGANLHPDVPVDRHVFVKRVRVWVNADGFITPLHLENLVDFSPGPPAAWRFVASAGDSRAVEIQLTADLLDGRNTTVLRFHRPATAVPFGHELPPQCSVSLTVRFDLEDRSFHSETQHNGGADFHFQSNTHPLADHAGFAFTPAADRQVRVGSDAGIYHPQPEWCDGLAHPVEGSRGQVAQGDAFSPGWFELPLAKGAVATFTVNAESAEPPRAEATGFIENRLRANELAVARAALAPDDDFGRRLALAVQAFVARRGEGKTVIAGYPWFLDWGRDSLICARGLLAAGLEEEVRRLLLVFGGFEQSGTLPNSIHGEDASNRDTSDAPLWFGVACEDLAARAGDASFDLKVNRDGRTLAEVLKSIAIHYRRGTPNGIIMDPVSALIWSPSHFTWMDTNFPAGTPREGYPIEIQVLWIRLLRVLERLGVPAEGVSWQSLAEQATASVHQLFWLETKGWLADVLVAPRGQPARGAAAQDALRSNSLMAVSLGVVEGERARRNVEAAARHLVVPGALRSLAPLPVSPPLPVRAPDGRLLNDPHRPYWGRYEGDEDTQRKPAYHNGTAWAWTFPGFCEALAQAWNFSPDAVAAARSYLGSADRLLAEGCIGQLPEITDGDAPHTQRGCDAQAWGATEALRVWKLLQPASQTTAACLGTK